MLRFFPILFLIGLIALIPVIVILWRRKKAYSYLFFFSLFWVYALLVVGATLFPMPVSDIFSGSRDSAADIFSRINWIPFAYPQFALLNEGYIILREVVANIIMTMPFGLLFPLIVRVRPGNIVWIAIAVGLGIETTQLLLSLGVGVAYRGVDINDSITNAVGVVLGYGWYWLLSLVYQYVRLVVRNRRRD